MFFIYITDAAFCDAYNWPLTKKKPNFFPKTCSYIQNQEPLNISKDSHIKMGNINTFIECIIIILEFFNALTWKIQVGGDGSASRRERSRSYILTNMCYIDFYSSVISKLFFYEDWHKNNIDFVKVKYKKKSALFPNKLKQLA